MTGHELKEFLEDLDWEELDLEVAFCAKISLKEKFSLVDIDGAAVADGKIAVLSEVASQFLEDKYGKESMGMEDEDVI